tara:strand:+ start:1557 stop:3398 length:1842 start_codon:yes stop_codon:yes gene_type:complete
MWPEANVAIRTGEVSNTSVVDLDGDEGKASYQNTLKAQLPATLTHKTPKGMHLLFAYHPDLKQTTAALPGVDIRNDGGYIVAPPSSNDDLKYEVVRDLPPALLETIPLELSKKKTPRNGNTSDPLPESETWVTTLLRNGAAWKTRNDSATKLIGYFHGKGIPSDIIEAQMAEFAERCDPPMDLTELRRTIESVTRYQQRAAEAQILDPPVERRDGEDLVYEWEEHQVSIKLSNLHHSRDGLQARIEITTTRPGRSPKVHGPVNWGLYSTSGRATLVRYLKTRIDDMDWGSVLENTAKLASDTFEESAPVVLLSTVKPTAPAFAVRPLVSEGETTVMFGTGDSGKSYISLALALALHSNVRVGPFTPIIPHRTLYLDWETNEETHAWRLQQLLAGHGIGGGVPDIAYIRCYAPLTEHLRAAKKAITDHSLSYVVIDSAAAACGGEPEKAEMALRFMNALRSLSVSATVIAHSVKANSGGMPFGSVFWHNEPRATFEFMPSTEERPNEINVGVYNRKSNNAAKSKPMGLQLAFTDDSVKINQIDIQSVPDLAGKTAIKDQIFALLKNQQLTVSEIADELDLSENTVLQTLKRNEGTLFVALPDTYPTLWARHARF